MNEYALHYTNDPDSLIYSIIHTHHQNITHGFSDTHIDNYHTTLSHEHVKQLKDLLQQNRKDELWCDVVLPYMHSKRMQKTVQLYPELNIPRNRWLDHPHWSLNKQMTAYHVPIRCKMQQCLSHLWDAWQCTQHSKKKDNVQTPTILQHLNHAQNQYRLAITILESHAHKEESHTFPIMVSIFHKLDLYDMYDSHHMMKQKAQIIDNLFNVYIKHLEQNKRNIHDNANHNIYLTKLIEQMLLLDTFLNQHLHEEEDLLVPMSLCVPDAMHVSWPYSPETEGCNRVNESLSHWTTDPESVLLRCKL